MKNILITGASGMLGASLANYFKDFHVFGTADSEYKKANFKYKKFNLLSENYDDLINWSKPDIIIHCAAITNGNICEENPNLALNVNGLSVKKLLLATNNNVKLIYISTDAVFPSELHMAKECDCTGPENIYGKSKELGEFFLNTSTDRSFTIIRTTIVGLNLNKENTGFVEWIINSAKNNEELGLFNDVLFTPISIWDLANEIKFLINSNNISSEILHIGGESCTKYAFGYQLLKALNISTEKVIETSILKFKERAKRCMDQSMNSDLYKKKYKRKTPTLIQTINTIKKNYHERN